MKFKIKALFLLGLCNVLFASHVAFRQLFDKISNSRGKETLHKAKSLFDFDDTPSNSKKKSDNNLKGLFDFLNFNQIQEKNLGASSSTKLESKNQHQVQSDSQKAESHISNKGKSASSLFTNLSSSARSLFETGKTSNQSKTLESLFAQSEKKSKTVNNKSKTSLFAQNESENKSKSSNKDKMNNEKTNALKIQSQKQNGKTQIQISKNQNQIKKLTAQTFFLMKRNEELIETLSKLSNKKEKKNIGLVGFIQKYDKEVNILKHNMDKGKTLVENKILKRQNEFKSMYNHQLSSFSFIQKAMHNMDTLAQEVRTTGEERINALTSQFSSKEMIIDRNLEVKGVVIAKEITVNSIQVGNIQLQSNEITFANQNSKIIVGSSTIPVGGIIGKAGTMQRLIAMCGDNFEKCQKIPEPVLKMRKENEDAILINLKWLKVETSQILNLSKFK